MNTPQLKELMKLGVPSTDKNGYVGNVFGEIRDIFYNEVLNVPCEYCGVTGPNVLELKNLHNQKGYTTVCEACIRSKNLSLRIETPQYPVHSFSKTFYVQGKRTIWLESSLESRK